MVFNGISAYFCFGGRLFYFIDLSMKKTLTIIALFFCSLGSAQVMYPSNTIFSSPEYRAFDFWIGEWDVDLKIRNEMNEWPVAKQARVKVFPVLQGKAIMELWSEKKEGLEAIRGFSLRYYNDETEKWDLILHWPRPNWGRTAVFQGEETHGRFDFHVSYPINDSTTQMVKYTFSDISEESLRWQDFYSRDGGTTWTSNWIMEFTRVAQYPEALSKIEAHTYLDGGRCSADQYETIKKLAAVKSFEWRGLSYMATTYKILDGCASLIFGSTTSYPIKEKLLLIAYNTPKERYEVVELSSDKNPLEWYLGSFDERILSLESTLTASHLEMKLDKGFSSFTAK